MMKKLMVVVAVMVLLFCVSSVSAEDEKDKWKPITNVSLGMHSAILVDSGMLFKKPVSTQTVMLGVEKGETGFYLLAKNYVPSKEELNETDFFVGAFTKIAGVKIDFGYARYWTREKDGLDFNVAYATIETPEIFWKIVPFLNMEYDFPEKSLPSSFFYRGGLNREFKIYERLNFSLEASVGGNTGIGGSQAEALSFTREKLEIIFSLADNLELKTSALMQQNVGRAGGIADDANGKIVSSVLIKYSF